MTVIGDPQLAELESILGYVFRDRVLLRTALVHRSWIAESNEVASNERLEFLGDAVLGWVVADLAFHRLSDMPESKLTDLRKSVVNAAALSEVARSLGLGQFMLLGKGEDSAGGRNKTSILADAFEAVIGAIYLDGGVDTARAFVERNIVPLIEDVIPRLETIDYKSMLQELAARLRLEAPRYEAEGTGPDHDKEFTASAIVGGRSLGSGKGRTKKAAEQIAAHEAYEQLISEGN
jgi:ribonuclease-3